ncbi:dolichol kinase [Xenococcus sp. PCC 7305]|uniref:diacylglycerol/polyprenol kinase family protein n=1 Tax=Xenococcus sp. PCC 7305 TaxID=102125 RepID=UPI0002ABCCCA|nr:diacylglycerol/polyprenol kinase family protein [Xenococcus sp. PCC 7305]ELS00452.1 dolichol kinase [Xenococcus sp. PCC 7305]
MLNATYPLAIIFLYLVVLVTIAETLSRFITDDPELTRKIVHIGSGNVILLAWWLGISGWVIIVAAAIASVIAITSYLLPILPSINSIGRKSLGTLFYAISIGILTAIFWEQQPQYTAIGILVMAWGDGMAAIIGQRWGKHQYQVFAMTKSWEGSLAMAASTYIVTNAILLFVLGNHWQTWLISAIAASVATSLEAFSKWGIDNLTVPLGTAIVCYYCQFLGLIL